MINKPYLEQTHKKCKREKAQYPFYGGFSGRRHNKSRTATPRKVVIQGRVGMGSRRNQEGSFRLGDVLTGRTRVLRGAKASNGGAAESAKTHWAMDLEARGGKADCRSQQSHSL